MKHLKIFEDIEFEDSSIEARFADAAREQNFDTVHDYTNLKQIMKSDDFKRINIDVTHSVLRRAVKHNDIQLVKELLKSDIVDPTKQDNLVIQIAVEKNFNKIVKLLLARPDVDPSVNNNNALQWAFSNSNIGVIKMLLAHPKIDPADVITSQLSILQLYRQKTPNYKKLITVLLNDDRVVQQLKMHMLDDVIIKVLIDKYDFITNEEDLKTFIELQ